MTYKIAIEITTTYTPHYDICGDLNTVRISEVCQDVSFSKNMGLNVNMKHFGRTPTVKKLFILRLKNGKCVSQILKTINMKFSFSEFS